MGAPNNNSGNAPQLHVAAWKAMPMFAVVGGLLAGVQVLVGLLSGDHYQRGAMFLAFHTIGILPWALAGALYARLANRSGLDLAQHRTRSILGAKAGAITSTAAWCVVGLIFAPWLWSQRIPGSILLMVAPTILVASAISGALQGWLTALIVGRFALEPRPAEDHSA
jgi:hypothetical protein